MFLNWKHQCVCACSVYVWVCVRMCVYMCACMRACLHTCMCVCVCMCVLHVSLNWFVVFDEYIIVDFLLCCNQIHSYWSVEAICLMLRPLLSKLPCSTQSECKHCGHLVSTIMQISFAC